MRASLRALARPFAAICIIALAIGAVAYALQASADPATSTDYAEYRNGRWHFSLAVPVDMKVGVYDQAGGGQTMQFIDATGQLQFQVSAWPYSQLDLTLSRIGEPSATSDQPDHLEIVDIVRDDTFTVLFQKNGIRYAVVALPDREKWLIDILK
jgi:hypothetical protein